jgi:hypothetical protein
MNEPEPQFDPTEYLNEIEFDPFEIAKVGIPPLTGVVATILAIGLFGLWAVLAATPMPALP